MSQSQTELRGAVAEALLEIKAVHYAEGKPFVFTSGTESPVYVDCRKLISFPLQRNIAIDAAIKWINSHVEKFDVIAGGETAGIPYASFLADRLGMPMVYIRKKTKGFGTNSRIEGQLPKGARVLLVEDLIFDAHSKISFAEAIRSAGAIVTHTLVVFEYGRREAVEALKRNGLTLVSLASWNELLDRGTHLQYFTDHQAQRIREFLRLS